MTESPESPVRRVRVNAKDKESVRALVYQHHPRGRVLSVSEVTDAEIQRSTTDSKSHGEGPERAEIEAPE